MTRFPLCAFLALLAGCDTGIIPVEDGSPQEQSSDDDSSSDVDITNGVDVTLDVDSSLGDDDSSASADDDSTPTGYYDTDGDGRTSQIDCDDQNPGVYPGAEEICDGRDNDCNGQVDEGLPTVAFYVDTDTDGYGAGEPVGLCYIPDSGYAQVGGDCNDADAEIHPGAQDVPGDGIDQDCDDESIPADDDSTGDEPEDDDATSDDDSTPADDDVTADDDDATPTGDDDTSGDDDATSDDDATGDDDSTPVDVDGDGYSEDAGDCNDTDAIAHPGAIEICDGDDQDCDGQVDEGFDADGDGYSTCEVDCDDTDATVNPNADEADSGIDGEDNDCDGNVDEAWQAYVSVEYLSTSYYVLNVGFYTSGSVPNALGWQESDTQTSGTTTSVEFLTSDYGDMSASCGLIVNVSVGNPATSWLCQNWEVDPSVFIDAWIDGVRFDETNVQEWIADEATGSCAAVIQTDSRSACDPVDDE